MVNNLIILSIFYLLAFSPMCLDAQVKDSLQRLITNADNDTTKIQLYNELGYNQIDTSFNDATDNIEKALKLSRETGYTRGEAISLYNIGRNYAFHNQFEKAIDHLNQSIAILSSKHPADIHHVRSYTLLGWVNNKLPNYYEALSKFQYAKELAEKIGYHKGLGDIYVNIGKIYYILDDKETAVHYYDLAAQRYTLENNKEGLAFYYTNIGFIQYKSKDYNKSLKNYNKALVIAKDLEQHRLVSNIIQNKINVFIETNQLGEIDEMIAEVYQIDSSLDDDIGLAYLSIARAKINLKDQWERKV